MSFPGLSFIRDFGKNTILIYPRKTQLFLPIIYILIIKKLFIHFHLFSVSEDFKERHNNTDFTLMAEVIFLCHFQLYCVFLKIR